MKKLLIIISLIIFGSLSIFSQTEQYSAPVKWELYRVSDKKVSLLLPKMPVLISESNICTQTNTDKYAVYADDVIYGLNINSKLDEKVPDFCPQKREFDENSFKFRISELKNQLKTTESKTVKINNLEAEFIKGELFNHWLVNDYKNKQWFELWTANSDENRKEVKDFLNSMKIGDTPSGIEIEKGSSGNKGDFVTDSMNKKFSEKNDEIESGKTTSIKFITKPAPKYTDQARKNNTQGEVLLRITFLANGGIGSISPVKTLPYGLTEQAIFAARRIMFLPARSKDVNISATKTVRYTFTIY